MASLNYIARHLNMSYISRSEGIIYSSWFINNSICSKENYRIVQVLDNLVIPKLLTKYIPTIRVRDPTSVSISPLLLPLRKSSETHLPRMRT